MQTFPAMRSRDERGAFPWRRHVSRALFAALAVAGCASEATLPPVSSAPRSGPTLAESCAQQPDPKLCEIYPCFHGTLDTCRAACAGGDAAACESFGQRVCRERSAQDCEAACDAGNAEGCRSLAHLNAEGARGLTKDPENAVQLLRRACDLGGRRTCPVVDDPQTAHNPLSDGMNEMKSCELGGGRACKELGDVYFQGQLGQTKDPRRAGQYYELACDPALTTGPTTATTSDHPGVSGVDACTAFVGADAARAAPSFEETCVRGNAGACKFVAEIAEKDAKMVAPEARAIALHQLCSLAPGLGGAPYNRYCRSFKEPEASP